MNVVKYRFTATANGVMALTTSIKTPTAFARGWLRRVAIDIGAFTTVDVSITDGVTSLLVDTTVTADTTYQPQMLASKNTDGTSAGVYVDIYVEGTIAITLANVATAGTCTVDVYIEVD